jgi:alcohol dehydrogenase class IV
MTNPFRWVDGERTIVFGRGSLDSAVEALGGPGYTLLTTARAKDSAPGVVAGADSLHVVPGGHVDQIAADMRSVRGERLVALGGGRVIDVAKALAAANGGRAMAVPTTLSGAEMTRVHRHAVGVDESTPRVRCAVVVVDPALAASQAEADLAASSLNALGHAIEAPCMTNANPVATLAAHEAARLLRAGWAGAQPDRDALALGSLLAGYALDNTGLALHHVLAQTLVRLAGVGHGPANAAMLPHSVGALAWRRPEAISALTEAVGEDLAELALRIRARTGSAGLRDLGVDPSVLPECADAAAARPQLRGTPPAADRAEVLALYENAL